MAYKIIAIGPDGKKAWITLPDGASPEVIAAAVTAHLSAHPVTVDTSGKVDKVAGKSLVDDREIIKIHASGSDNQDLSHLITDQDLRLTDERTPKAHTHPNDHAAHSDDQDLSSLVVKITGKGLSTNDYTTAEQTKLAGLSNYVAPAFNSPYRTLLDSSGSHIAAKAANTYGMGQGDPLAVTGTGTLYPLNTIYIAAADYPTIDGKAAKLRVRAIIECNDVAPFTGTFKVGLHPVTRPATSGGAGLCIYTIGSPVANSQATGTNLAADSQTAIVSIDFDLPADGFYVLAVVTSGTMATSSHVHISASLQIHNA